MTESSGIYRSPQVKELVSNKPGFLVMHGYAFLGVITLSLLAASWFIHYPDTIHITAAIEQVDTSGKPIVLKANGRLRNFYINEGQMVSRGDTLGCIERDNNYNILIRLLRRLDSISVFQSKPKNYIVKMTLSNGLILTEPTELSDVLSTRNGFQAKMNYKKVLVEVIDSLRKLANQVTDQYFIIAPIDGKVFFPTPLSINSWFNSGVTFCTIKPSMTECYIKIQAIENVYKIKKYMPVLLHNVTSSSQEWSNAKGYIESVKKDKSNSTYVAKIVLADKKIIFTKETETQVEIIIKDKRLLQKLSENFFNKLSN